ncbi:amidohydrolase [Ekhidna sp.]|uniref:amidohydrolase n=1 Tax=Ekhidna sp. TaxID=2608089 RepID=UPI003297EEE5
MEEIMIDDLTTFRRELHQNPEVSQNETETQRRIIEFLNKIGVEGRKIGGTGVYVDFNTSRKGKTIMLRSDHDALPIHEINDFEHKSKKDGVSHKCGHDGHTAIMCGVADYFKHNPLSQGRLILIFQPAEENGEGAKAVLADKQFNFNPDLVFALHNLPGYPLHEVVVKEDSFTSAAKSIIIKLDGKTSHAAEPEKGINPAMTISELVTMFEEEAQPDWKRDDFALTTPIFINMGELSYGVSAGHGEVHYTLRTWSNEIMEELTNRIMVRIDAIAAKYDIQASISWTEAFESNRNDSKAVKIIKEAIAANLLNSEERTWPFKWGEDFGLFTQKFPGAMFGIGSGENCPALHNPDYDYPDEITETGIKMFTVIVEKAINE